MKTTKADILGMFKRLCKALNKNIGSQCGDWSLEYISTYGGWIVVEHLEQGGENHPLDNIRRSNKEMYLSLYMAAKAIELTKL